jgi:hypothetical protein
LLKNPSMSFALIGTTFTSLAMVDGVTYDGAVGQDFTFLWQARADFTCRYLRSRPVPAVRLSSDRNPLPEAPRATADLGRVRGLFGDLAGLLPSFHQGQSAALALARHRVLPGPRPETAAGGRPSVHSERGMGYGRRPAIDLATGIAVRPAAH